MDELRCPNCSKLLLKATGNFEIEIKCPKCKEIIKIEGTECQEHHQ